MKITRARCRIAVTQIPFVLSPSTSSGQAKSKHRARKRPSTSALRAYAQGEREMTLGFDANQVPAKAEIHFPFRSNNVDTGLRRDDEQKAGDARGSLMASPLRQRGQATVEYIIATLAVILLLVIPIPGLGGPAGQSVIGWLWNVLQTWWMNFTFLISLP